MFVRNIFALRSHHVWQMQRLDLKVESVDVRCACGQNENVVGGRPLVFVHNVWILLSLVSYVFCSGSGRGHACV